MSEKSSDNDCSPIYNKESENLKDETQFLYFEFDFKVIN